MKHISLVLLLLYAASAHGQDNPAPAVVPVHEFEHEDECGSPVIESMGWRILNGTAIRITGGHSFILRTSTGRRFKVDLVALDTSHDQAPARALLSTLIQGQDVTVLINFKIYEKRRVVGAVLVGEKDINRELLRAGVARFKEPPLYRVSNYTACLYRITEREARHVKSGS
jgi:hypothetical protein